MTCVAEATAACCLENDLEDVVNRVQIAKLPRVQVHHSASYKPNDLDASSAPHVHRRHHSMESSAVLGAVNALRSASTARSARPSGIDGASAQPLFALVVMAVQCAIAFAAHAEGVVS